MRGCVGIKRNIHDSTQKGAAERRVNLSHPSTRRKRFTNRGNLISVKGNEKATVIFDCGINQRWKAIGVDPVAVWFVVLLVARVVDKNCRGCRITTNNNVIKCVGLVLGV